jgi:hypothetical protein
VLVFNRKPRVANDVDEQNMGDFELDLLLDLGRHVPMRFIHTLRCPVEEIKIDNRTLRGVARYQPAPREGFSMSVIPLEIKIKPEKPSSRLRCLGNSSGHENRRC